jgi:hypothetical protein
MTTATPPCGLTRAQPEGNSLAEPVAGAATGEGEDAALAGTCGGAGCILAADAARDAAGLGCDGPEAPVIAAGAVCKANGADAARSAVAVEGIPAVSETDCASEALALRIRPHQGARTQAA